MANRNKRLKGLAANAAKLALTIAGFWLLLTHEVGTWNRDPYGVYFAPVEGDVPSIQMDGTTIPPLASREELRSANGYWVDSQHQMVYVRLPHDKDPRSTPLVVAGEPHIGRIPIGHAIADYVQNVDPLPFFGWSLVAMTIKFAGVLASCAGWQLLLRGQGIVFPFWQQGVTSFLIGRFIGTFLPSTIGLDAYTLYEAGRYSNQWHRAIMAKALEKFMGIAGLFTGLLLTLPAGYAVLHGVAGARAGQLTAIIGIFSATLTFSLLLGLARPRRAKNLLDRLGSWLPGPLRRQSDRFLQAAAAYEGQTKLIFGVLLAKFATHFSTAIVYYFTAMAIGVVDVEFIPVVFGSLLQILGTLFSPTMAGEGAREALQALLLSNHLGGAAQAVLSAALGFVAAEAATLWGGAFLWTRKAGWRPTYLLVDGQQVDYSWLKDSDAGFNAEDISAKIGENRSPSAND